MQYKIVYEYHSTVGDALRSLESEVKILCKEGWKPQGGISITSKSEKETWCYACQAMVKE